MPAFIIDGKKAREVIRTRLQEEVASFSVSPYLVIFQVGENPESDVYVKQKILFGTSIGAKVTHARIPLGEQSEKILIEKIKECNADKTVHGIIVQLPLPNDFQKEEILSRIDPEKDVDGLHEQNRILLERGTPRFIPATARGIFSLLDFYSISVKGKKVVVLGRSELVGKPTALLARVRGGLVTVCHSKTEDVPSITKTADVVIVAVGKEGLIGKEYVSEGQVVIDVGIHSQTHDGKKTLHGDVKFDEVSQVVSAITPVPGGVGPMTVSALFENLLDAVKLHAK